LNYNVQHRYVFMPTNLDSYFDDVAWIVVVTDEEGEPVCDVINDGEHGTEINWISDKAKNALLQDSMSVLPDSIDPVRDYIDQLIERHHEENEKSSQMAR